MYISSQYCIASLFFVNQVLMCANSKPPNKIFYHKLLYLGPTFLAVHSEDRVMIMRVALSTFKTHKISYSWDWLLTTNNVRGPVMGRGQQGESRGAAVMGGHPSPTNKFSPRTISRLVCSQSRGRCWWRTLSTRTISLMGPEWPQ